MISLNSFNYLASFRSRLLRPLALASVGATMAKAFAGTNGVSGDTAELDALASKVPEEIRAEVETLAQAFSQYASKLKDIEIAPARPPQPPSSSSCRLRSPPSTR